MRRETWFRGLVVLACVLSAFFSGCSRDPNVRKHKYLESGQRFYEKGQYREAAIQFQNAIQVDSQFVDAHYQMALTALKLQQFEGAYQELNTTIQLNPDHYAARLELAKFLIAAHEYPAAKEHLDFLTQRQPNNPEVYLVLSSYQNLGNKDTGGALASLHKALQLDPNSSDAYLNLGSLQAQTEQWSDAEASIKKGVQLSAKSENAALIALGDFYQGRGRYPEAEQSFQSAIQAVPTDPSARLSLASLYLSENKLSQAEDLMRKSKSDFPYNSTGYTMLGNFYISTNQMDKALTEYTALYKDHAKDPVVKKNYIQLLILRDHFDEAEKLNEDLLKVQPPDTDAQIFKAQIETGRGKTSDAINTLQEVLKKDSQNGVAHYRLGLAFDQAGNAARAESEWREAVRINPEIVEAHRALAGSAIHRSDPSMLAQEADQIMALQPGSPDGYMLRGVAEIDRKNFSAAEEYLKRSLEKEPNNPAVYVQLGNLRVAQNQWAEAQKAYQQGLDQDPNSTEALGGVLNMYMKQEQFDKALAVLKAAVAKNPNNSAFHTMLGSMEHEQFHDSGAAEAEYRRAVEVDKNNTNAMVGLGIVENERGNSDAALQTYADAMKINPKDIRTYLLAGGVYQQKKKWDDAKQMYQKALTVQPDNPLASNNLAYVMLQQGGNVDMAFQLAQTARRQLPSNPNTADTLGWAFYQRHVYTSAISLLKEAVKQEPENALFNYHLGLAYAKGGQTSPARQQLDKVRKLKPNSPEVDDLQQALTESKG